MNRQPEMKTQVGVTCVRGRERASFGVRRCCGALEGAGKAERRGDIHCARPLLRKRGTLRLLGNFDGSTIEEEATRGHPRLQDGPASACPNGLWEQKRLHLLRSAAQENDRLQRGLCRAPACGVRATPSPLWIAAETRRLCVPSPHGADFEEREETESEECGASLRFLLFNPQDGRQVTPPVRSRRGSAAIQSGDKSHALHNAGAIHHTPTRAGLPWLPGFAAPSYLRPQ